MTTLGGKLRIKSIMLKTYDTPDSAKLLKTSSQLTSRNFPENLINFFFHRNQSESWNKIYFSFPR